MPRAAGGRGAGTAARAAALPGRRFDDLEAILPYADRAAIVNGCSRLAGFATEQVR